MHINLLRITLLFSLLFTTLSYGAAPDYVSDDLIKEPINAVIATPATAPAIQKDHPFKETLTRIDRELQDNRYSTAIYSLSALIGAVREKQREALKTFLPEKFETYKIKRSGSYSSNEFSPTEYGVLFNQYYENPSQHSIQIHIIFSDPSIREYANLAKNPDLLKGLDTTSLVRLLDKYSAIQKVSGDGTYIEQNIIINDELLINIVANGHKDEAVLERFSPLIKLEELEKYLKY